MKRLIECAALLLVAAVVVSVLRADDFPLGSNDTSHSDFLELAGPIADISTERNPLREQYLEQQRAKAALMSDDELKQAIQSNDAHIRAMQAKQKLDQTAEALRSIVSEFEGTPSASVAQEMLATHERGGVPVRFSIPVDRVPQFPEPRTILVPRVN